MTAIFSDDPNALGKLLDRIARLEAQRARIRFVNTMIRKVGLAAADLTPAERADLMTTLRVQPYYHPETKGYPPYVSTNLSGNIARLKKRYVALSHGTWGAEHAAEVRSRA